MEDGHRRTLIPPPPVRPDVPPGRLPPVTWQWWEAVVVFLIAVVVGGVLALPGVAAISSHNHRLQQIVAQLGAEIGIGGTVLLWLWLLHRRSVRAIGVPDAPRTEIGVGVVGGIAIYAVGVFLIGTIMAIVLRAASNRTLHAPRQLPAHLTTPDLVLAGITVILVAPVAEELFFRGLLFRSLRSRHTFAFAGTVSAVCFGAAHYPGGAWQNALLLPLVMCFVGYALARLYEWRGNIVANMAAHATFNVIGFLVIALVANH
jgi:membrane protease YdiL (CAAX protease family)